MAESDDSIDDGQQILSYEHQVTKVNNHLSKDCDVKENESYLKMLPVAPAHALYPYNSCHVCVGCGSLFQTPDHLIEHWEHTPKCNANLNEKQICESCKSNGVTDSKHCKHFTDHDMPRVMLVDSAHVMNYDQAVQTESNQNDFNCMNTGNYNTSSSSGSKRYSENRSKEESEKEICPLPPPPQHDPHKPLPYRIDFLLNSGVIKHARMNINGKTNNSLFFEKKRPRKPRTHFTDTQIEDLEKVFDDKKYLSASERQIIATDLSLHEEQVKNWFQNRRSRWRKDCRDAPEELAPQQQLDHMIRQTEHSAPPDNRVEVARVSQCGAKQEILYQEDKHILRLQT